LLEEFRWIVAIPRGINLGYYKLLPIIVVDNKLRNRNLLLSIEEKDRRRIIEKIMCQF
jgi:hypothetical protein